MYNNTGSRLSLRECKGCSFPPPAPTPVLGLNYSFPYLCFTHYVSLCFRICLPPDVGVTWGQAITCASSEPRGLAQACLCASGGQVNWGGDGAAVRQKRTDLGFDDFMCLAQGAMQTY